MSRRFCYLSSVSFVFSVKSYIVINDCRAISSCELFTVDGLIRLPVHNAKCWIIFGLVLVVAGVELMFNWRSENVLFKKSI